MQSQRVLFYEMKFCYFRVAEDEDEEKAGTESNSMFPSTEINVSFTVRIKKVGSIMLRYILCIRKLWVEILFLFV